MATGLARVTISAPARRVDVALPEHLPLVELLPELLRHAGEGLADDGEQHGGWLLRRTDGTVLHTGQALLPQGVRDGEVLHLVPARAQWPELEYDDVVEAIADGARRSGAAWSAGTTRVVTLGAAGALLAVGLLAVLRAGPAWATGAFVALGAALALGLAGVVASRAYGDAPAGATLGGYAMPYAFVGGALLVTSGDSVGVLGPLRWLGAPELLAGSVALLLSAVLGMVSVAVSLRIFAAGVTVGLFGSLGAAAGFVVPAAGSAALLISMLVCSIGALPLLAIRFGKLPMPPITLPTGSAGTEAFAAAGGSSAGGARERPDRERVFAAVARAEQMLTGMLIGYAVLTPVTAVLLVTAGGSAGQLLTAVSAAALLLRARLFVTVRQRVPLIVAGVAGFAVLGLALTGDTGGTRLLGLTLAALLIALLVVVTGATYATRPPTPYLARAADLVDTLMVISVVPVACAVLGLYERAQGLLN